MNVLLISINRLQVPYPVFPLGLEHVARAIEPHQARLLDLCAVPYEQDETVIAQAIKEFAPQAVGLSIRNIDNNDVAHLQAFLAEMRATVRTVQKFTTAPIILGGAGYTIFPSDLLRSLGADYGIVGEGERLKGLLDILENNGHTSELPPHSGVVALGDNAPDPIPWDGNIERNLPPLNPLTSWYLKHGGMLNLQTQRGCPFRCVYCSYPAIEGHKPRFIDASHVARVAISLQESGAKFIFISDSSFNADIEHSLAVGKAFREVGLSIPWGAFFTPLAPPNGYFDKLAEAGLTHVEFGTDTLCDTMLRNMQKPFTSAHVLKAHIEAKAAGLCLAHFMLLGGPGETISTIEQTLQNCEKLEESALFFFCGIRIYPRTDLWHLAVREGQINENSNLLNPLFYLPKEISLESIIKQVERHARGRTNWIVGGGGERASKLIARMHDRGSTGPLWERLI